MQRTPPASPRSTEAGLPLPATTPARPGLTRRDVARAAALAGCPALLWHTARAAPTPTPSAATPHESDVLHVLNRLGYGPAPGELARVADLGLAGYIDEQLQPRRIELPAALAQRLQSLPTLAWSTPELAARYRAAIEAGKDGSTAAQAARRDLLQPIVLEAGEARLAAAVQSPRQLEEVLVDFWFNHFNVFAGKGLDRVLVAHYEREAIRPHVLGRFRDLLGATARHPAMLFYLDNWLSAAPGFKPRPEAPRAGGLNENYARELMELHTLGVDGGYTQRDVTELARIFTGWTLRPAGPGAGPSVFAFAPRRHDTGSKQWLGHTVAPRGQAEGEWALDVLAAHPATARHVSRKLAQYFVADTPPAALVDRLAARFGESQGDIAAVLRLLFDSPEFRAPEHRGTKFKTPYRYLVSTLRAGAVPVDNVRPLLAALAQLGMPLYGCATPDGYKNTEAAWLSPDAMTRRIGFATAVAAGRLPLARPADADGDPKGRPSPPEAAPTMTPAAHRPDDAKSPPAATLPPLQAPTLLATLGPAISARTRAVVVRSEPALQAALVLGSPDFMRH
jgi:uncharacterized protein (DUF1800 family)